jgi:hypothetical protein
MLWATPGLILAHSQCWARPLPSNPGRASTPPPPSPLRPPPFPSTPPPPSPLTPAPPPFTALQPAHVLRASTQQAFLYATRALPWPTLPFPHFPPRAPPPFPPSPNCLSLLAVGTCAEGFNTAGLSVGFLTEQSMPTPPNATDSAANVGAGLYLDGKWHELWSRLLRPVLGGRGPPEYAAEAVYHLCSAAPRRFTTY